MATCKYRMYLINQRMNKKLSARKVSMAAGISHQHYASIEYGKTADRVSFKIMVRIAQAVGMPLDEFSINEMEYLNSLEMEHELERY